MKKQKHLYANPYFILILGFLFLVLSSAKWTVVFAPWLGYTCLLYFTRNVKIRTAFLLGFVTLFLSGIIATYEVIPMPLPVLVILIFITSFMAVLVFLIDRWTRASQRGFLGTLIFPAAFVTLEYINISNTGNSWSSVANTQYAFQSFQQIASVFGLWGISFMVYWFASLTNWIIEKWLKGHAIKKNLIAVSAIYIPVFLFGFLRLISADGKIGEAETVMISGVTIENKNVMETLYYDEYQEIIDIPADISQTSPLLQEVNRAMVPFIEDPFLTKYAATMQVVDKNLERLFHQSMLAADRGARIVVWSEAIGMVFNNKEEEVIQRARELANAKDIYLVMGLAVINPGPLTPGRLFLVNKTVTVNPAGEVENIYLKSNPVPFAEQDYGSDGVIPVIETPYGKLSPVICYDADFPQFMRQAGMNGTDILLVPSGDWKAIAPYHSYMASLRGIENGTHVVRPVSHGTSLVTNAYGDVLASNDFFSGNDMSFDANVPTKGIDTIYNRIGDILAYLCVVITVYFFIELIVLILWRKVAEILKQKKKSLDTA